jgi:ribonuclease HII
MTTTLSPWLARVAPMVHDASGLMESRLFSAGFERIAGADEVGRGSLAGPLVAAAVVLSPDVQIEGLRDSKMLTKLQRSRLAAEIHEKAVAVSIVHAPHSSIDRTGLQKANLRALRRALVNLDVEPDYAIVDCFKLRRLSCPSLGVKKGDAVSRAVAAASIVAKVHRDQVMTRYHRRYPRYGFASNSGYGTRHHWNALKRFGPSPIHRLSFFGVYGFPDEDGVIRPHVARDFEEPTNEPTKENV